MKRLQPKLLLVLLLCISCKHNSGQNNRSQKDSAAAAANNIAGNFSNQQKIKFDAENLTNFMVKYPQLNSFKNELDSFYYNRKYAYAWFDEKGLIEQAANLYNHTQNIGREGIKNRLPYQTEFTFMMSTDNADSMNVNTEIMLTAQYFVYAKSVWTGLSEKETRSSNWFIPRKKISYALLLDSLINGKDLLNSPPVYRQYSLLKNQLKKYEDIKQAGGFPIVDDVKKSLKKGDSSVLITTVKKWFFISGDLPVSDTNKIFDNNTEAAVKKMQKRFGLTIDGVIGKALIKELNLPLELRMQQIMVNMERSRWVPVNVATDYLVVNIPEFKLHAYENDNLLWSMDAVVGKPVHNTVIFSGKIKYVVFSPYWNVPTSILQNEILPGIRRNQNYLANHHMEWSNGQVRQRSGPDNALGFVKFLFPNSYNIYLHDTPSKSLFSESTRAFSHGCIRLSDAEKLANYLLKNDTTWTAQKIYTAMHLGKEEFVTLKKSETVFIVYFTTWVDSEGQLNFRKDLYNRDNRLATMLFEN
jgi:murein L,D-transpeptidase YcbB/YkuD